MLRFPKLAAIATAIAAAGVTAIAGIERLTLEQMVERTDNAVYGEIVSKHAFKFDHPIDGPDLVYTSMTIEGRSLVDGSRITVDVLYHGGKLSDDEYVWNSEAPTEQETAIGNKVVAFYTWTHNMGGDLAGNALEAGHGGLYRTVDGPKGTIVMGRGDGYAIGSNQPIADLDSSVTELREAREKR